MTEMIEALQAENLLDFSHIRHGFFTRKGGVSQPPYASLNCAPYGDDNPDHVAENYMRIARALHVTTDNILTCRQTHTNRAVLAEMKWDSVHCPEADAIVTQQCGIALGILTADCVPILFVEPEKGIIGAAHAGWRGALGGIIKNTIMLMEEQGAQRSHIHAALGPCIWQDSYEVDASFLAPFLEEDGSNDRLFIESRKRGHFMFDLPSYVVEKCEAEKLASIMLSPADTCADEARFFSHRRGTIRGQWESGRMISCIALHE